MATLRARLETEIGDWFDRMPPLWRSKFQGIQLNFNGVDPEASLRPSERIWPQARNKTAGGPARAHLFRAFQGLKPDATRVVIFGNDPYTRIEQATGRSFEQGDLQNWTTDIRFRRRISPSFKSILCAAAATSPRAADYSLVDTRMIYDDYKDERCRQCGKKLSPQPLWICHMEMARALADGKIPLSRPKQIFDDWTRQGVFWLNCTLTYTKWDGSHRKSHQNLWRPFTDRTLEVLVRLAKKSPIVFALWGSEAQKLEAKISRIREREGARARAIRITKAGHPQWPEGYFENGNPLAAINRAIGQSGPAIRWV